MTDVDADDVVRALADQVASLAVQNAVLAARLKAAQAQLDRLTTPDQEDPS